jgi:glycosyltransferase involved in cell wall biosynthesis
MMLTKPVIVSDCPPLRRVVEKSGGGLVFRHDEPAELAESMLRLYGDGSLRENIARDGRKAFLEKYNWELTSGALVELYGNLAGAGNGAGGNRRTR